KLLRDVRLALVLVAVFLAAFQCLWVKITDRLGHLTELLRGLAEGQRVPVPPEMVEAVIFQGPGRILQSLMGGESLSIFRPLDLPRTGYVPRRGRATLCVWAIGRAAGALVGELDRGTLELLLAQPVPRSRLILAHFLVDLITIPVLCLGVWAGNWLGGWLFGV